MGTRQKSRYCVHCGKPGPFRSPQALKCVNCDKDTAKERKEYHREYHRARGLAIQKLIEAHKPEFERLMVVARTRIADQQRGQQAKQPRPAKKSSS